MNIVHRSAHAARAKCPRQGVFHLKIRGFATGFFCVLAVSWAPLTGCAGVRKRDKPCARGDAAQCRFENAITQASREQAQVLAKARKEREQTQKKGWEWADQLVEELANHLGDGMDASIVHARSRQLCQPDPQVQSHADQPWACPLEPPLVLGARPFVLEYSPDGVLSLACDELSAPQSGELLARAVDRWRSRCLGQQFEQVEGDTHHEIYRCALPEGPLLVLGRFDRDLDADRWQLSFAIVAVG